VKSGGDMTNLVFDLDGTLHDTIRIYAPAFRKAYQYLTEKGFAESREWTDKEISRWLGYNSRDMWNMFMPGLPDIEKDTCSQIIGSEMLRAIKAGEAQLYEGVTQLLQELKADGYRLVLLSNCKTSYMNECIKCFVLEQYFSAFYCTEQFDYAPKDEIFKEIVNDYPGQFIIIGDRETDLQIAKRYGLPFIGCSYGYGDPMELREADYIAETPVDIQPLTVE
jgi:phosphoglycolate phosphatase